MKNRLQLYDECTKNKNVLYSVCKHLTRYNYIACRGRTAKDATIDFRKVGCDGTHTLLWKGRR